MCSRIRWGCVILLFLVSSVVGARLVMSWTPPANPPGVDGLPRAPSAKPPKPAERPAPLGTNDRWRGHVRAGHLGGRCGPRHLRRVKRCQYLARGPSQRPQECYRAPVTPVSGSIARK